MLVYAMNRYKSSHRHGTVISLIVIGVIVADYLQIIKELLDIIKLIRYH